MPTSGGLAGWDVLVTRPVSRAGNLSMLLQQQGANTYMYPTLVINIVSDDETICKAFARADIAVFVSVNAVDALASAMDSGLYNKEDNPLIATVGSATSMALQRLGLAVNFTPTEKVGSEGLIEILGDIELRGKEVAIFSADTGRPLLAEYLGDQGVRVNHVLCYQRQPNPDVDPAELTRFLIRPRRMVSITSVESARALLALADPTQKQGLLESAQVTISERVRDQCAEMGFRGNSQIADNTSDQSMVAAAVALAASS